MRTRTGSPSCMRCGWSGASYRCLQPFPPRARTALHEAVLNEILEERVASSRGWHVPRGPRGVKGKLASRVRGLSEPEFQAAYGTEEQCRAAVEELRWPTGFVCPICGGRQGTR